MAEIVVGIPTFRRPRSLSRLLDALEKVETDASIAVIVADNDAERQEGYEVCLARRGYRWPLIPVLARERGIAQARNTLVAQAMADGEMRAIAMIDDDEWPSPQWLAELLKVQRDTGADAVGGSILFGEDDRIRSWNAGFDGIAPIRGATGPIGMLRGAGNLLVMRRALERFDGEWFDRAFALTGGEDRDFFENLKKKGARFAWADGAIAYGAVASVRRSLAWTLRRAFSIGNAEMRILLKHDRRLGARARECAKIALVLLLSPPLFVILAAVPNRAADVLRRLFRNAGKVSALFGRHYDEYATTHGE
ncbi:MAG: glycosyltransferase [Alphaproteobacteria bacterium]|nr:glycosyltransferase [Alphaproteobacteria bacterium]